MHQPMCHGMTSLFPFSSLSAPHPISITFRLHPTLSTCLPLPLLQLQGVLVQLCYIHAQTSLRLTSDLLGPDPRCRREIGITQEENLLHTHYQEGRICSREGLA